MKLVLKLPKGKAPFIGIHFDDESEGQKLHAEMVDEHRMKEYEVYIEVMDDHLNLRVACRETVNVYFYNNLFIEAEKLTSWIYMTKHSTEFTFGHIFTHLDKDTLIKTRLRNPFFLRINKLTMFFKEDVSELPGVRFNYRNW